CAWRYICTGWRETWRRRSWERKVWSRRTSCGFCPRRGRIWGRGKERSGCAGHINNHPVCAAKERDLLLMAQPPLLENGGEWGWFRAGPIPLLSKEGWPRSGRGGLQKIAQPPFLTKYP